MRRFALAALLLAGCPLSHDDFPDRSCMTDRDCFRAQGEQCNQSTRLCEMTPDAAVDAPAPPDAPPRDAPPDSDQTDAEDDAMMGDGP